MSTNIRKKSNKPASPSQNMIKRFIPISQLVPLYAPEQAQVEDVAQGWSFRQKLLPSRHSSWVQRPSSGSGTYPSSQRQKCAVNGKTIKNLYINIYTYIYRIRDSRRFMHNDRQCHSWYLFSLLFFFLGRMKCTSIDHVIRTLRANNHPKLVHVLPSLTFIIYSNYLGDNLFFMEGRIKFTSIDLAMQTLRANNHSNSFVFFFFAILFFFEGENVVYLHWPCHVNFESW